MRVTLCKLCDYFFRAEGGKGSLIGMFDGVNSRDFPFQQPAFHVCVEFEFEPTESNTNSTMEIALIDEDGRDMFRLRGEMSLPVIQAGRPYRMLQDFRIDGLRFESPGSFRLDVSHNGRLAFEERLYVTKLS